jgi:hypothetical protein
MQRLKSDRDLLRRRTAELGSKERSFTENKPVSLLSLYFASERNIPLLACGNLEKK